MMKRVILGLAALTVAAGLSAPAMAQTVVVHPGPVMHHHGPVVVRHHTRWVNVCRTEYRHHQRVRVCHRVRR